MADLLIRAKFGVIFQATDEMVADETPFRAACDSIFSSSVRDHGGTDPILERVEKVNEPRPAETTQYRLVGTAVRREA